MTPSEAMESGLDLAESRPIALVGSIGSDGYPQVKAMMKMEMDGLRTVWFSTNTSSRRVAAFREDPKACVYFMNEENFDGLLLTGSVEVLQDKESRQRLWRDGFEYYYPQGVDDPDYAVLRFTAISGNFFRGLQNRDFIIEN